MAYKAVYSGYKTCQKGVIAQPWSSQALCQLGTAQLATYDNNPDGVEESLLEARLSFKASIEQEGKPSIGTDVPEQITKQTWWQLKFKKEKRKKDAEEKAKTPAKGQPAGRGRGVTTTARGSPARGSPARGSAARGSMARGAIRGASTARGGATKSTNSRSGAVPKGTGKAAPLVKTPSTTKATAGTKPCSTSKTTIAAVKPPESGKQEDSKLNVIVPANIPLNRITYPAHLGLARALSRNTEELKESEMLYNDVITMAPQMHDAYIELADLLSKTDPLKAVDVYARYPFQETSSFDDAYLHGEILRLLMKSEQFDDPRLQKHMIAWGRVMGIGCLEKYVEILDSKFKTDLLKNVYAGVNHKSVDDPDLQDFFRYKMWLG